MSAIKSFISAYEDKYHSSFNLVSSENLSSPDVRRALSSDLNHRYAIPPEDKRPTSIWDYPNQSEIQSIIAETENLACEIYNADLANVFPLSGNQIAQIMLMNLLKTGDTFFSVGAHCGGHFTTIKVAERLGLKQIDIPYDVENGIIDVTKTAELAAKEKPKLIFLDASMILFPYPLKALRESLGSDVIISYDGSHTLGIIGGGLFQSPLEEGADFLHGSTHKSLWGPQKGMILSKTSSENAKKAYKDILPFFVSNVHVHHIAALGIALEEMKAQGQRYAQAVINNARILARTLHEAGLHVPFEEKNYTTCHQILLHLGGKQEALKVFKELQEAGLNTNAIRVPFTQQEVYGLRIGLSEVTRRGAPYESIEQIGHFISDVVLNRRSPEMVYHDVRRLSSQYPRTHYTL